MPVANYANEMLKLWEVGCEKAIPLEFKDKAQATRFRFRMNSLRQDMRKEKHVLLPFAEKCMMKLRDNVVILCPIDDDFAAILREHGITADEPSTEDIKDAAVPDLPSGSQTAVDEWKEDI